MSRRFEGLRIRTCGSERVAVAILKVSQRLGGVAAGAYDVEGGLAEFVFGMTGVQDGEIVHWSETCWRFARSHRTPGWACA